MTWAASGRAYSTLLARRATATVTPPRRLLHERTGLLVRSAEGCAYQIVRLLRTPAAAASRPCGP